MSEYHVGCGLAGIYVGTLKKNGTEWQNKSLVTDEAERAVLDWYLMNMEKGKNIFGYEWEMKDGRIVSLIAQIKEVKNDWIYRTRSGVNGISKGL